MPQRISSLFTIHFTDVYKKNKSIIDKIWKTEKKDEFLKYYLFKFFNLELPLCETTNYISYTVLQL